jgi:hypothetical protein
MSGWICNFTPGNFVIVKITEFSERIPLTVADWDEETGIISIVFMTVGASTHKLAELEAGDEIEACAKELIYWDDKYRDLANRFFVTTFGDSGPDGGRASDVLDPTDAARAARGKTVGIEEREDGSLSFWHGEHELLATAFPKDHGVPQGEVVENKRLSAALDFIKEQQRERTDAKVAKPSTTRRNARLLRAGTPRRIATVSSAEIRP